MANESVRIQDDLYAYVNQDWIDRAEIPDDEPVTGSFNDLSRQVEERLIADFQKMRRGGKACTTKNLDKAIALFALAQNTRRRNREGIAPALETLHAIDAVRGVAALNGALGDFVRNGWPLPFTLSVEADMKDTSRHAVTLAGPRTILPDTTYYAPEMAAQRKALLGVWTGMAKRLLAFTDLKPRAQARYLKDAVAFDAVVATLVKSSEEWSDYPDTYHPMPTARAAKLLRPLDLPALLAELFPGAEIGTVVVQEPRFLKGFSALFREETFQLWKHWAYVRCLCDAAPLLSEEQREIAGTYKKALSGVVRMPSVEKFAFELVSDIFSEPIGLYYGRTYFGAKAKKDVIEMVEEIIGAYAERVRENPVLSPETREKAVRKLGTLAVKMGYPDRCGKLYDKLVFGRRDSLFTAVAALQRIRIRDGLERLGRPVDRGEWPMAGHIVNACYNPLVNDITFPAAILQPPFYSIRQSRSENLGGIGAVIGHEISHAFDNNGAQCDEKGNLNNWWTKEDFRAFRKKTRAMIREFDGIELPWGKVNSAFIVSENIADNGGMAVTLHVMGKMPDADYRAYFINWARVWCIKMRPEIQRLLLQVDVHAPALLRGNMPPRNFPEWYETFGVKRTDGMYLAPSKRVVVW